jgi:hypothetical protein
MKILFENWRRYLKEQFDDEELEAFDIGPSTPQDLKKKGASIGYGQAGDPSFIEGIKTLFINTPDKWVIVVLDNINDIQNQTNQQYFMDWLKEKNYPRNAKILVVGSSALKGDETSADWIAHDIIGHTVGSKYMSDLGHTQGSGNWMNEKKFRKRLIQNLVSHLQTKNYPISKAGEAFDMLYDVMAAIVLKGLSRKEALDVAQSEDQHNLVNHNLVNEMFDYCDNWVSSIPSDNTKVTVVEPW